MFLSTFQLEMIPCVMVGGDIPNTVDGHQLVLVAKSPQFCQNSLLGTAFEWEPIDFSSLWFSLEKWFAGSSWFPFLGPFWASDTRVGPGSGRCQADCS